MGAYYITLLFNSMPTKFSYDNLISVPEVGIEPTSLTGRDFKSRAYTSSATRAYIFPEATARIELAHKSFADSRLTTCLRGHNLGINKDKNYFLAC